MRNMHSARKMIFSIGFPPKANFHVTEHSKGYQLTYCMSAEILCVLPEAKTQVF
jgi:hypothetical protein